MAKFDKVIPPGQEGKIELVVEGEKVHGEFNKTATVHTNDPMHSQLTIAIAGKEIPYVNVMPEGVLYLHGRYGEKIEKSLTLTSNEKDADFKVTGVTSNLDDKLTYVIEPGPAAGQYTVIVNKNPKLPTMNTYGSLFVHTNSKGAPETTIQVHVMTRGSIMVSPPTLNFGAIKFGDKEHSGESVTKSVMMSKTTGEFEVTDITLSNPNFKAVVEQVTPGKQYRLQVTFQPPVKRLVQHSETGEMIIHTNDELEPAIRVQVVARAM